MNSGGHHSLALARPPRSLGYAIQTLGGHHARPHTPSRYVVQQGPKRPWPKRWTARPGNRRAFGSNQTVGDPVRTRPRPATHWTPAAGWGDPVRSLPGRAEPPGAYPPAGRPSGGVERPVEIGGEPVKAGGQLSIGQVLRGSLALKKGEKGERGKSRARHRDQDGRAPGG